MTNDELNPKDQNLKGVGDNSAVSSSFGLRHSFGIRHSSFDIRLVLSACSMSWHRILSIDSASIADSLFSGLGVKCFSYLLVEGVAFAFGREPFVFGLDVGFAFL